MALIDWTADLSVGISEIDDQHQKLIGIINQLHDAMRSGKGNEALEQVFASLVDYASIHFNTEERLMQEHDYPEFFAHRREHDALVQRVVDLRDKLKSGQVMISMETMTFLKEWLANHIKGTDKKYSPFLRQRGVA